MLLLGSRYIIRIDIVCKRSFFQSGFFPSYEKYRFFFFWFLSSVVYYFSFLFLLFGIIISWTLVNNRNGLFAVVINIQIICDGGFWSPLNWSSRSYMFGAKAAYFACRTSMRVESCSTISKDNLLLPWIHSHAWNYCYVLSVYFHIFNRRYLGRLFSSCLGLRFFKASFSIFTLIKAF